LNPIIVHLIWQQKHAQADISAMTRSVDNLNLKEGTFIRYHNILEEKQERLWRTFRKQFC